MPFSSGFFNAKNRDRVYTAENFTAYLSSLICNGILDTYGECFAVTATNSLSVAVGTGKAWINGHYFNNDSSYMLDLSPYVDASSNRYAAIGICCDSSARECSIVVKAEAAPAIPAFADTESQTYLTLAAVYLPAGGNTIIAADILDFRDDENKCGYVKCILGKCGITDLLAKLDELAKRAAAIEGTLSMGGLGNLDAPLITFSQGAMGMVSPVCDFTPTVDGLVGIVGSLDGLNIQKEEDE